MTSFRRDPRGRSLRDAPESQRYMRALEGLEASKVVAAKELGAKARRVLRRKRS